MACLTTPLLCAPIECTKFQGQDYRLYLSHEKAKLVVAHTVMLILCSISKKEWNYLERKIEHRIVRFSGKRRLLEVVKGHLLRNLIVWPEIHHLMIDDTAFAAIANTALSDLEDAGLITSRLEDRCFQGKHYGTFVYSTTEFGLQYFEKWIDPLLKTLPSAQRSTHVSDAT